MGRGRTGGLNSPRRGFDFIVTVAWLALIPPVALCQPVEETIELNAGWNAVWINVEPEPNDLLQFLALQEPPLGCQSVWTFEPNRDVTADPATATPGRWLMYDKGTPAELQTLQTLQGGRAYLINANVGGAMRISGRPVVRAFGFTGRVSNLFGAMSDVSAGLLTFEKFFSHPNATGKIFSGGAPIKHDIFSLSAGNLVRRQVTAAIDRNEAYWLNVVQDFAYAGPLDVTSSANGLSFGRTTAVRTLSIDVPSSLAARAVMIRARPCLELGGGECSVTVGGIDWLEYRVPSSSPIPEWLPLTSGLDVVVPPGTTRITVELRARRALLSAVATVAGGEATLPPLVVDVTDDQGSRVVIPSDVQVEPVYGLWAGRAILERVSVHPSIQDLPLEDAVATPLEMSLILDLPSPGGGAPLLMDAITIATFRDGRTLQRRFTSVLLDRPVVLTEDAGDPIDPLGLNGTLHGALHILPEDPLNPYRHRYHPEHRKGYEVNRDITITFNPGESSIVEQLAGLDGTFGPQRISGVYTEVITGLSQQSVTVQGNFRLERVRGAGLNP